MWHQMWPQHYGQKWNLWWSDDLTFCSILTSWKKQDPAFQSANVSGITVSHHCDCHTVSTVVHLEEKLFLLYFPTVITPIISDISALWMVQIQSSFKGRQRQSNYTPAQLKQLINLSAAESVGALNTINWISSVTAVQNCFCRRCSVWHRPWVKSTSPLFRTTRWWLWRAKCRGTAARLCLQKYFCSGSCQHSGGGGWARKAGKYPGDGTSAFLRGRPRGTQQPRRRSDFLFFFFFTLGIFQKVSQFAFN